MVAMSVSALGKSQFVWSPARCVALDFGPIHELREKYGARADIAPLPDPRLTSPNLIVSTCSNSKLSGDTKGKIQNPTEVGA